MAVKRDICKLVFCRTSLSPIPQSPGGALGLAFSELIGIKYPISMLRSQSFERYPNW